MNEEKENIVLPLPFKQRVKLTGSRMKGIYILFIWLDKEREISIGGLGSTNFKRGFYFYVGSAQNGLESRIKRHFSRKKRIHWHIDYFLKFAEILGVISIETSDRNTECRIAKSFGNSFDYISKFGSSDCRCNSHLFLKEMNPVRDSPPKAGVYERGNLRKKSIRLSRGANARSVADVAPNRAQ